MATILDKDHTVRLLREEFAAVDALCSELGEGDWLVETCLPGWTVKDQLSHMAGTERMLSGETPPAADISSAEHLRNDIGRSNEVWVEANRPLSGPEVLQIFETVTAARLAALDAMTQADFDAPSWTPAGPNETYGRFMRIRHFDCFMHENDIRQALGVPERADPEHVRSSLDEVATALGYIVGKRARLPSGTSVKIELTGPAASTYLVAVEERANLVDRLESPPTTTLRLSSMLFLRLTGGREDASPHLGNGIEITGDADLGTRLATNLAFTI